MRKVFQWLAGLVLASFLLYCPVAAQAQRLVYRVDLRTAEKQYVSVTLQLLEMRPDTLLFQMPLWAPGIYREVHYGRFIRDLEAFDTAGNELSIKRLQPDCWRIAPATAIGEIRYKIQVPEGGEDLGPSLGLAKIGEHGVFANAEAIFGYIANDKAIPSTVIFTLPKDWQIATTLDPATEDDLSDDARLKQLVYNVSDYEELAESPLIAAPDLRMASFHEGSVDYHFITAGDPAFPLDSFMRAAHSIVQAESSFYGNPPFEEYSFLIDATPQTHVREALAHCCSSVYSLTAGDMQENQESVRHLIAATFFKTWNGKRFHISPLGPVDYTTAVSARSLWMSEGISEYYADLLRVRYGVISPAEFFNSIDRWQTVASELDTCSLEGLSLQQQSEEGGISCAVLRARGALAALLMDIEIRSQTNNRRSLDNVLLRMNNEAASGKTYDDKQLIKTFAKYSATNLDTFYTHYIAGRDPLPVEAYLARMGAARDLPESMLGGGLDLALNASGTAIIEAVPRDTSMVDEIVHKGDTVAEINGQKVTPVIVAAARTGMVEGVPVKLKIVRNAKPIDVTIASKAAKSTKHVPLAASKHATPQQLAMRKSLMGKRKMKKLRRRNESAALSAEH